MMGHKTGEALDSAGNEHASFPALYQRQGLLLMHWVLPRQTPSDGRGYYPYHMHVTVAEASIEIIINNVHASPRPRSFVLRARALFPVPCPTILLMFHDFCFVCSRSTASMFQVRGVVPVVRQDTSVQEKGRPR